MKSILYIGIIISTLFLFGCEQNIYLPDLTPPSSPRGLQTETGDNFVEIFWNANPEPDVAGYNVFVSSSYSGNYELIGFTKSTHFVDNGAKNGHTYYYAVSAYDFDGNESKLSHDFACETPRPEGYSVVLRNYRTDPNFAGYDFSTYSIGKYNDQYADVFFEFYNGIPYLNVWEDSDIQDMGYTYSLYDIGAAPLHGWSSTKDVPITAGHTYIVWTWDNHYAKLRIASVSSSAIECDWAYQLQPGNVRLKQSIPTERNALVMGKGVKQRQ